MNTQSRQKKEKWTQKRSLRVLAKHIVCEYQIWEIYLNVHRHHHHRATPHQPFRFREHIFLCVYFIFTFVLASLVQFYCEVFFAVVCPFYFELEVILGVGFHSIVLFVLFIITAWLFFSSTGVSYFLLALLLSGTRYIFCLSVHLIWINTDDVTRVCVQCTAGVSIKYTTYSILYSRIRTFMHTI